MLNRKIFTVLPIHMRTLLTVVFFVISSNCLFAFEGNVQLTKQSYYDTTYFIFYIKEAKVRVDEFNVSGQLIKTLLIDLTTENIVALSPSLKLFTDIKRKENPVFNKQKVEIIKTDNFKIIDGKKCFQWRVRNRDLDCEITYWVTPSEFSVIQKLYYILNATENYSLISSFFMNIPDKEGYIPLVAVERNLVREERQTMQITSINERKVSSRLFEIPHDYKNLRI